MVRPVLLLARHHENAVMKATLEASYHVDRYDPAMYQQEQHAYRTNLGNQSDAALFSDCASKDVTLAMTITADTRKAAVDKMLVAFDYDHPAEVRAVLLASSFGADAIILNLRKTFAKVDDVTAAVPDKVLSAAPSAPDADRLLLPMEVNLSVSRWFAETCNDEVEGSETAQCHCVNAAVIAEVQRRFCAFGHL